MDVSLQSFDIYAHPQASLRQDYKVDGWLDKQDVQIDFTTITEKIVLWCF